MAETEDSSIPAFLGNVVDFPSGISYEFIKSLTNFRKCHDGEPAEGRVLFTCRRVNLGSGVEGEGDGREFVVKVKVQMPDPTQAPSPGPSDTTAAELKALELFTAAKFEQVPHLVAYGTRVQGEDGMVPGGYVTYTIMTKMAGKTLLELQYWAALGVGEREEIVERFLGGLRSVYALGVEPIDCALRNVMWEKETEKCSIIDFELWREVGVEGIKDEKKALQRWGLERRPAPRSWWDEWNLHGRG